MYHREYEIESTQVNASRELKLASLLGILQDVAINGAEYVGVGTSVTLPKGLLWVVSRMEIQVERMPKYQEKVDVYTYPGITLGFFYPRHFFVKDKEGNILLRASSVWALIHADDRRIEMRNQFPDINGSVETGELPRPAKLIPAKGMPLLGERVIRYSDVDLNGHLNNTKYVEIIEDLESGEVHARRSLKRIVLNYEHELREGETITLTGELGMNAKVTAWRGEEAVFEAEVTYR